CRRAGLPFYRLAVPCALGLTVFTIGQRLTCFANGCCFGLPTASPLGHRFPPHTDAGILFPGVSLHPTQLYTVAVYVGILAFLLYFAPRVASRPLFGAFMILVGAERLANEALRWHSNNDVVLLAGDWVITGHAAIALGLLAYGLAVTATDLRAPARRSAEAG
ncbi:MAG TPA: prolipoprotein diacylglyceryl transferase family protein, partial [Thermoanaerobaculia bacterium]|nr:prolipoprotein diacylglyceryl transferase family protein [Thermoanaerobaculia bacterium]